MFGQAVGNPAFDWRFSTIPQPGASNKPISYARGKMMGGSSGLNYMAWDRASKKEYDAWEKVGMNWLVYYVFPQRLNSATARRQGLELEELAPLLQEDGDRGPSDPFAAVP